MNRCTLLLVLIASSTMTFAQKKSSTFTITGTVKGMADRKVYLSHVVNNEEIFDSTQIENEKFVFTGSAPGPYFYFVSFENVRGVIPLFVENAAITLNTDTSFKNTRIVGSQSQIIYSEFSKIYDYIHKKAGIPNRKFQQFSQTKDSSIYYEAKKEWDEIGVEADSLYVDFVKRHPASPVSAFVIIDRFINYTNPPMIEKSYKLLQSAALNSVYGKQVTEYRKTQLLTCVGAKPAFTLTDTTGKKVSLKDFKGQYVLVDFWASWCGPCRKENPTIVKAYSKYHSKGFEVVAISLDDKRAPWIKAINADGLPWKHVSDLKGWKSDFAIKYGIRSIPANFLVNKDGEIIAKDLRGADLETKLAQLLL